jgi:hypothetical protein
VKNEKGIFRRHMSVAGGFMSVLFLEFSFPVVKSEKTDPPDRKNPF